MKSLLCEENARRH